MRLLASDYLLDFLVMIAENLCRNYKYTTQNWYYTFVRKFLQTVTNKNILLIYISLP